MMNADAKIKLAKSRTSRKVVKGKDKGVDDYLECGECGNFELFWLRDEKGKELDEVEFVCGLCMKGALNKEFRKLWEEMDSRLKKVEAEAGIKEEEFKKRERVLEKKIEEQNKTILSLRGELKEEESKKQKKWSEVVGAQECLGQELLKKSEEKQKEWEEIKRRVSHEKKDIRTVVNKVEREKNIIMRGIKEGEEELNEIQKLLEEIANEGFEEGNGKRVKVKVTKVVRLGINNSANVDRPLKVELENEYQAYRVLRGKAGLREKGQRWSKVFLDEDLNWAERRKRVELRKKLKELRKEGIYCFIEGEVIKKR